MVHARLSPLLLLIAVTTLACGPGGANETLPDPCEGETFAPCDPVDDGGSEDSDETTEVEASCEGVQSEACVVFALVNDVRAERGLAPYAWNVHLARAAKEHAVDMHENNYFAHLSQDGRNPMDRAIDAGYANGDAFGENIARGQPTPAEVMQTWMTSDGHRGNILSEDFAEIGVGMEGRVWVQVFGHRR